MAEAPQPTRVFRFGPYEADLDNRELRKNGLNIRLQGQPFEVLALLLEHSGRLVTREQLRAHLWSAGTVVEFDHSVHTAVTKLREALGDDADNPRFVATVPRHGYRFIAPVLTPVPRVAPGPAGGHRACWTRPRRAPSGDRDGDVASPRRRPVSSPASALLRC
jgi:DNA-binding winged helix-turn-helix (wHTH) protein